MGLQDFFHAIYEIVRFTAAQKATRRQTLPADPYAGMPDVMQLEDRILYNVAPIPQDGMASCPEPVEQTADYLDALLNDMTSATTEPPAAPFADETLLTDLAEDPEPYLYEAAESIPGVSQELVFVDTGVEDYETFLRGIFELDDPSRDIEIILFSSQDDGLAQISDILRYRSGVDAIHLVSHGDGEGIRLGHTRLDLELVRESASKITAWNRALDTDADLLIYGCDLASTTAGQKLIESLSVLCDCDVAASEDLTGLLALGGDGDTEVDGDLGLLSAAEKDDATSWHENDARQNFTPRISTTDGTESATTADLEQMALTSEGTREELVLVNDTVTDYEQLIADLQNRDQQLEVVLLDSNRDGIEQVSDILAARSNLSAVHFVGHGAEGQIHLGGSWLSHATLNTHSDAVAGWGNALTHTGDILFYGCNVAANGDGRVLLSDIAGLTRADVMASDDPTGHHDLGGDWDLEYVHGSIETGMAFSFDVQQNWSNLLATVNLHPTGAGSVSGFTVVGSSDWDSVNDQTGNAGTGAPAADDAANYLQGSAGNRTMLSLDDTVVPAGATITEITI